MANIIIGVAGDQGSFSEEAGRVYAKNAKIGQFKLSYLIDMHGVLSALEAGQITIGVFPVVNNNSGLVRPAFEAMGKYLFEVIDEVHLDVRQCLLAKHYMPLRAISAIYSYTPAFLQCKEFLKEELADIPQIDWGDTAKSARDLAHGLINDDCAVIASKLAAEIYDLKVLAPSIQDVKPNITMFVVVNKKI